MPREIPDLLPSRGRVAAPLLLEVRGELDPKDLDRLSQAPKTSVPVLQKLRAIHHHQARLLAQGKSYGEIAAIVGCTTQRLVQLVVDPAFSSLVEYYKDQLMETMLSDSARLQDKIVDVGEMAVDEMRERMENDERRRKLPIGEIRKIAEFAMDRTVAPPKPPLPASNTPSAITINFGTSLRPNPASTIEGEATLPLRPGIPTVDQTNLLPDPSDKTDP